MDGIMRTRTMLRGGAALGLALVLAACSAPPDLTLVQAAQTCDGALNLRAARRLPGGLGPGWLLGFGDTSVTTLRGGGTRRILRNQLPPESDRPLFGGQVEFNMVCAVEARVDDAGAFVAAMAAPTTTVQESTTERLTLTGDRRPPPGGNSDSMTFALLRVSRLPGADPLPILATNARVSGEDRQRLARAATVSFARHSYELYHE
jgi:hypothetical protein